VKSGATQQDYVNASNTCEMDRQQSGFFGSGIFDALSAESVEGRCMIAHGWTDAAQGVVVTSIPPLAPTNAPSSTIATQTPAAASFSSLSGRSLGISGTKVTQDSTAGATMPDPHGVFVSQVSAGSPAANAGIKVGDIIEAYDSHRVEKFDDLVEMVAKTPPGSAIGVDIWRDDGPVTLTVQFGGRI
jgi:membrane-associated protease RseP (regulator of RpoE activity)